MKKIYTTIVIIILILIYAAALRDRKKQDEYDKEYAEKLRKEYPNVDRERKMEIKGIVYEKKLGLRMYTKSAMYITLNNGQKFSIGGSTINRSYTIDDIMNFIQIGDSINKRNNDDLIIIYRDTTKYYFVLGQIIRTK